MIEKVDIGGGRFARTQHSARGFATRQISAKTERTGISIDRTRGGA